LGIHGNSHIMMLERNNVQVANLVSKFLHENGLDRRRQGRSGEELASR
jgi:hypothetical protein